MPLNLCLALLLFLVASSSAVNTPCSARSAREIVGCALEHHPDVARAQAEVRVASFLPSAAGQRPNPELDSQVTAFGNEDQPALATEANVLHTFELGNKRKRRLAQAEARQGAAQARLRRTREEVAVQTVLKLHRLRQIASERHSVEESIGTFGNLIKSLESRPRRSAEQDVSLNVFLLAEADYKFRMAALQQEEDALSLWFTLATGLAKSDVQTALPPEPTQWPEIASGTTTASATQQLAAAALAESKSNLALADSQAWPDLKAGPRIDAESGHGMDSIGGGAAVSLALPLYQRNQGERRVATAEAEQASLNLRLTERELASERRRWLMAYRTAVEVWRKAPQAAAIEKRHQRFEDSIHRGLIPASLTVEAHRQMVDFTKARHEDELSAVEALWSLYVLDGRFEEAPL